MQPKQQFLEWLKQTEKEEEIIQELERIAEKLHTTEPGEAFKRYVSSFGEERKHDLEQKLAQDDRHLSPDGHSLGKWPDDPAKPVSPFVQSTFQEVLRILGNQQQGMVHVTASSLLDSTDCLRQTLSHLIVERARQLASYNEPKHAFTYLKTVGGNKVYTLDPKIAGYEMTIISRDEEELNSIVQKFTKDETLDNSFRGLAGSDYYRSTAEHLYDYESWGLLASKPGHTALSVGRERIVDHMELERQKDLQEVDTPVRSAGQSHEKELRTTIDWQQARQQFQAVLTETESKRKMMLHWYELSKRCNEFEQEIHDLRIKKQQVEVLRTQLREKLQQCYRRIQSTKQTIAELQQELEDSRNKPFPITSKLLNTKAYREHQERQTKLYKDISSHYSSISRYENDISGLEAKLTNELAYEEKLDKRIDFLLEEVRLTEDQMPEEGRLSRELSGRQQVADDGNAGNQQWQPVNSPWITADYNKARSELFLAAMHVHECFIRAASEKMVGNIRLMGHADAAGQEVDKAIWQCYTLLIPAIAVTPAASLALFKGLKQEELGLVVVDQNSLTSSQSAAAAIWRARRVVVINK